MMNSPVSPVLQELRAGTQDLHREVEGVMPFFSKDFNPDQYQSVLQKFWGFYKSIESELEKGLEKFQIEFNYSDRKKTPSLERDLQSLMAKEQIQAMPRFEASEYGSAASVFGALYVIEGSSLGGQVITPHLHKMGISQEATHFFSGYGAATGKMWKAFQAQLASHVQSPEQIREAVASARKTFQDLKIWFNPR